MIRYLYSNIFIYSSYLWRVTVEQYVFLTFTYLTRPALYFVCGIFLVSCGIIYYSTI